MTLAFKARYDSSLLSYLRRAVQGSSAEEGAGMALRIRLIAGCFAVGVAALMASGTAAHANTLSSANTSAAVTVAGHGHYNDHGVNGGPTKCKCQTPTRAPPTVAPTTTATPPCQCQSPTPTPSPTCTCTTP